MALIVLERTSIVAGIGIDCYKWHRPFYEKEISIGNQYTSKDPSPFVVHAMGGETRILADRIRISVRWVRSPFQVQQDKLAFSSK